MAGKASWHPTLALLLITVGGILALAGAAVGLALPFLAGFLTMASYASPVTVSVFGPADELVGWGGVLVAMTLACGGLLLWTGCRIRVPACPRDRSP